MERTVPWCQEEVFVKTYTNNVCNVNCDWFIIGAAFSRDRSTAHNVVYMTNDDYLLRM